MSDRFIPTGPFSDVDFPTAGNKPFPIVEVFGYEKHLGTPAARRSFADKHCPFVGKACEKYHQYGYGYCSVQYKSKFDVTPQIYAVCDHRLDGEPVRHALLDYFGANDRLRLLLLYPSQS